MAVNLVLSSFCYSIWKSCFCQLIYESLGKILRNRYKDTLKGWKSHILLSYHGQRIYDLFSTISHLATSVFLQEQKSSNKAGKSLCLQPNVLLPSSSPAVIRLLMGELCSEPPSSDWEKEVKTLKNWSLLQATSSLATFRRNDEDKDQRENKQRYNLYEPLRLQMMS